MSTKKMISAVLPSPGAKSVLRQKRYLVLGSTGHVGVSFCTWKQASTITIPDYDVIIVDMPSLAVEAQTAKLTLPEVNSIRDGLLRVLASGGHLIIIADIARSITAHVASSNPREVSIPNYSVIPVTISVQNESGESISLLAVHRYTGYLSKLKTWRFHFDVKTTLTAQQSQQIVGQHGFVFNQTEIFMTNREGRVLAAEYKLAKPMEALAALFSQGSPRNVPQDPQAAISTLTILPCNSVLGTDDAIAEIIAELTGKTIDAPEPDWALAVEIPGINNIDKEISDKEMEIKNLSAQVEDLTRNKNYLLGFRKLVYAEGGALEEIVKVTLQYFGASILPAKYSNEEYILGFDGHEYIIEVKGITKSVSLTHFRQLMDYVYLAEESCNSEVKGILIANPWREISPSERNTTDKPEFPDNVIKRAKEVSVALVATRDLLHALILCMSGKMDKRDVLKRIVTGNGRITFE